MASKRASTPQRETLPPVVTGRVIEAEIKRVFQEKSFGFAADDYGREYFIHRQTCQTPAVFAELREGTRVKLTVETSAKGLRGLNVEIV